MGTKKLILFFSFACTLSFGQEMIGADDLVTEGVAYYDKGDYEGAIKRYDKALAQDKDNLRALIEKGLTLLALKKYDEAIEYSEKAIKAHPGMPSLKTAYLIYGNALDELKKTDKSIEIYEEAIKQFPDFYMLHFNKAVALSSVKKNDEAMLCLQKSAWLNPRHAGTQNAIGLLSITGNKKIPAILAYSRFLAIEPETDRSKQNLKNLKKAIQGNVEVTGKKSVTINSTADALSLGDTTADGKPKENDFGMAELILMLQTATDIEKKNKKKTEVENFIRKFETLCASLKEGQEKNYGFFWEYYVPYFIEMNEKNLIEPFAYIIYATDPDPSVLKWLKKNEELTTKFFQWSKTFEWKQK